MVRLSHALLLVFALITRVLATKPAATVPPVVHGAEQRGHDETVVGITGTEAGAGRGAHGDGAAVSQVLIGAAAPRLKLARRFLVGDVGGADSAAGPSCHSNNIHINCPPTSPH